MSIVGPTPPDQVDPGQVQHGTVRDGDGNRRRFTNVSWRPQASANKRDIGYGITITFAFVLLIAVAGATMYVSFAAQVDYISQHKNDDLAVFLAAISWDLAAVVFGLLGLATAMRGDSALRARIGNLLCVGASIAMNAAPASWDDPGSVLVWVGPPLLYAGVSDTIILEIQRRAMAKRGLDLAHASIWSVLSIILWGIIGVLAWILRLILAPKQTPTKFRNWYLDEIAYAPGRTVARDEARLAELRAGSAEEVAERVRVDSAAAITAAQQEAEDRVRAVEKAAAEAIRENQKRESARASAAIESERGQRLEFEKKCGREQQSLHADLERLREQSAGLRDELTQATEQADHGRSAQRDLETAHRDLEAASLRQVETRALLQQHEQEHKFLFAALSGRQQVEYLYARMSRRGDSRHGNPNFLPAIADEFLRQGVGVESAATVIRYLREKVSASGPQLAGVTGGTNGRMGDQL